MRSRGPAEGPGPGVPPDGPAPAIRVVDHLQGRVRRPVDLLRCLADLIQVALAIVIGLAASAAAGGTQSDIVGASRRLPEPLLDLARPIAPIALLILPVALAARQVYRRQLGRLAEGIATALLAALVVALLNLLLHVASLESVYDAIALSRAGVHRLAPLDPALAALAAFTTTIGLSGRPRWRAAVWLTVAVYSLVSLLASQASVLGLVIALLLGRVVGLGVRYVAGYQARRPAAAQIALALGPAGRGITDMLRLPGREAGARRYAAILDDGRRLDIMVLDRDQQAAGLLYRLYRSVRLQAQVSRTALLSLERVVERRALMSYAATEAGVATPRLRAVVQAGPEAMVLAYDHHPGSTLTELRPGPTDEQLGQVWDEVLRLHEHRITHRGLTADQLQVTGDGRVMLLGLGNGDVAASELQIRLDIAQLIAELAVLVGPDRSAALAREKLGAAELAAVVPLLQPVAMHRTTRKALQRDRDVLPTVRRQLLGAQEPDEVSPAQLERIRPRALVTLIAGVAAVYLLASQLAEVDVVTLLRSADWRWTLAALILSAFTYLGAAYSLSGFVLERLRTLNTFLVQVAGSFVTLVTPPAVGGVALNIRYLRRSGVSAADSAASVGVTQAVAFALHAAMLVIVAAITGTASGHSLKPPTWALYLIAAGVAVLLVIIAIPAGRRLLWARAAPMFGEVIPRLLDVAQQPVKLAQGIGGAFLLTVAYILCLDASIRALGGSVPLASVALVYLTGNAIGSLMPTPGGLGAVEAALSAGLTAAGLPGATAISAVLLFRTITFWLPVPVGWAALSYLQRKNVL
ncbi:MAG TPA: lysylphosphatidylglycerol synthase transmembrane domain-containing protein [Streptosporangiaceae bacterium]|jgi:glycosyltransferase 2 family protein|nr:lysylphosphatidylglycerol synthase transmembrane domain-containing protein [Streptosporangiaceae bacterium]